MFFSDLIKKIYHSKIVEVKGPLIIRFHRQYPM